LLLFALTGERGALKLPWLGTLLHRIAGWSARQGPVRRGAALGLLTPLLPCGLLWAACAAAAIAGSASDGSLVMAAFALGGLPLLVLVQGPLGGLVRRLSAARLDLVRRAAMALCAGLLLWRGVLALRGACCH
jgi:sulfite exporter TauE/SafE